jgi:hypothetical protein
VNDAVAVEPAVTVLAGVAATFVNVSAVFVNAHEMRSFSAGVTANDVPMPLGNAVVDPAVAFVHAYVLAYCPRFVCPTAASENAYVRDGRTATVPVVACAAPTVFPVVVADAIDAPFCAIFTVNSSLVLTRLVTFFDSDTDARLTANAMPCSEPDDTPIATLWPVDTTDVRI